MIPFLDRRQKGNLFEAGKVVFPLVVAMAASAVNQFIDRLFLSHYSDAAIEGSLPGGMLGWLFICFVMSTIAYAGVFVSQFHGAKEPDRAVAALGQGLWLTLASVPIFLVLIPLGRVVFAWCGHRPDVLTAEMDYYRILMIGAGLNVLIAVMSGYFAGVGRTRLTGVAAGLGNLLNIPLDAFLIFGAGPVPALGIAGAAWATVIAQGFGVCVLAAALPRDAVFRAGGAWRQLVRFEWDLIRRILHYGLPNGLKVGLDCFTFTVFVMLTARLDAMSLAVSNVVFSINHLSFAPLTGLNQGASVMVGNYCGAGDIPSARRAGWSCMLIACLYFFCFALFVLACGGTLIDAFHGGRNSAFDPAAFHALGITLMCILLGWGLADAVDITLAGALKGAGDTRFVMLVYGGVGVFLWMPALFAVHCIWPGIVPLWCTMPAYCLLCASLVVGRWCSSVWTRHDLVKDGRKL